MIDRATFVVSTWFASVIDPYCIGLRRNNGQRWIKITFFRNYDLLHTQQAGFPLEVLKEIIQAPSRLYPDGSGLTCASPTSAARTSRSRSPPRCVAA